MILMSSPDKLTNARAGAHLSPHLRDEVYACFDLLVAGLQTRPMLFSSTPLRFCLKYSKQNAKTLIV